MADLGLQAQAIRHFDFLVSERGYKVAVFTPYLVRFESKNVFIELVYDGNRSYEIGLLIGKMGSPNPPFTIDEIMRLCRAYQAESFALIQAVSSKDMAEFIERLAAAVRIYGGDFIDGSQTAFDKAAEQRNREAQNYAIERDLRAARAEAEKAWHNKDYAGVVKALKSLRAALTAAEVAKLEYAEKQCGV